MRCTGFGLAHCTLMSEPMGNSWPNNNSNAFDGGWFVSVQKQGNFGEQPRLMNPTKLLGEILALNFYTHNLESGHVIWYRTDMRSNIALSSTAVCRQNRNQRREHGIDTEFTKQVMLRAPEEQALISGTVSVGSILFGTNRQWSLDTECALKVNGHT